MAHRQTWVKVNAPVDQGVSRLVEALSAFPQLRTIESCQGKGAAGAWVAFDYGESWRDLASFVLGFLGPGMTQELGDRIALGLYVRESGVVCAELTVRPGAMFLAVRVLHKLKRILTVQRRWRKK